MGIENFTTDKESKAPHDIYIESNYESYTDVIHGIVLVLKQRSDKKWIKTKYISKHTEYDKNIVGFTVNKYSLMDEWTGASQSSPTYINPFFSSD